MKIAGSADESEAPSPASPACVASTARFLGNPMIQEPFDCLSEIVRQGRTVLEGQGTVEPDHPAWVELAHSMAPMMAPMAASFGLAVLATTVGGDAYTLGEFQAMNREAGFSGTIGHSIPGGPHMVVVGRRGGGNG